MSNQIFGWSQLPAETFYPGEFRVLPQAFEFLFLQDTQAVWGCSPGGMSPTSSRNSVPPRRPIRKRPTFCAIAPVKRRPAHGQKARSQGRSNGNGGAIQLYEWTSASPAQNCGPAPRDQPPCRCPVSPWIRTVEPVGATCSTCSSTDSRAGLLPIDLLESARITVLIDGARVVRQLPRTTLLAYRDARLCAAQFSRAARNTLKQGLSSSKGLCPKTPLRLLVAPASRIVFFVAMCGDEDDRNSATIRCSTWPAARGPDIPGIRMSRDQTGNLLAVCLGLQEFLG